MTADPSATRSEQNSTQTEGRAAPAGSGKQLPRHTGLTAVPGPGGSEERRDQPGERGGNPEGAGHGEGKLTAGPGLWSCGASSGRWCPAAAPARRAGPSMGSTGLQGKGAAAQGEEGKKSSRGEQRDKNPSINSAPKPQNPPGLTFAVTLGSGEKEINKK